MFINWINALLVSISMSVDCMTIGAADGIQYPKLEKWKIFLLAFLFGLFQAVMPTIGYFIGYSFQEVMEKYIPWIAFGLLGLLGVKNIIEWIKDRKESKEEKEEIQEEKEGDLPEKKLTIPAMLVQSVATSIDALCIGFVYLNYSIPQAIAVFSMIGIITFLLSIMAIFLGRKIGPWLSSWAGLIAGIVFIALGLKILLESLLGNSSPNISSSISSLLALF